MAADIARHLRNEPVLASPPSPGYLLRRFVCRHRLGVAAGVLSTISHSAGPAAVIYFVPQQLGKLPLAGTMVAFFWGLNLIKLVPFGMLGRLEAGNLMLALWMAPVIPVGVGVGYGLVRILHERHYVGLIYVALIVTSGMLILRAFSG